MGAHADELRISQLTKYGIAVKDIPEIKKLVKKLYAPFAKGMMIKFLNRIMLLERQLAALKDEVGPKFEEPSAEKAASTSREPQACGSPARGQSSLPGEGRAEPPSSPPTQP